MDARTQTAARPARILIAEDTPQAAELLEAYLCGPEYDLDFASAGVEKVAAQRPDSDLLDVMVMLERVRGMQTPPRQPDDAGDSDPHNYRAGPTARCRARRWERIQRCPATSAS